MKDNRLKEQVLKNIRMALIDKNAISDCDIHAKVGHTFINPGDDDLSVVFAKNFITAGGTLFYCFNESDIRNRIEEIQHRHNDIVIGCASENLYNYLGHLNIDNRCVCEPTKRYPLGTILCEALLAWQGSIVISSNLGLGRTLPALPETTIVIAFTSQVVSDWESAHERLRLIYPTFPDQLVVTNPGGYSYKKEMHKLYLILIEDETK